MKVFAYVIVVLIGGSVLAGGISDLTGVGWLEGSSFVLSMMGLMCLPIAVGIAILRYRLYEISSSTAPWSTVRSRRRWRWCMSAGWRQPSSCSVRSQANSSPNSP